MNNKSLKCDYDHACALYEGCIVNVKKIIKYITIMRVHGIMAIK